MTGLLPDFLRQCNSDGNQPESVYFYTFHKCASSLFGSYILRNVNGLYHVDYANRLFTGKLSEDETVTFERTGRIYGPIRLSVGPKSPLYDILIGPTSDPAFVRDKIAIFLVRDPRDILVSAYYSFAGTHALSPVKEIRVRQEANRARIRRTSVDDYVLKFSRLQVKNFKTIQRLHRTCDRSVMVKYEEMIGDFERFTTGLCTYIDLDEDVKKEIYLRSRPRRKEELQSHRRYGKVGGFRDKLKDETIETLNSVLGETLEEFEYIE